MAIANAESLPLSIDVESARPHEIKLLQKVIDACVLGRPPKKLTGDKAYDSDKMDEDLAKQGVELIAPHREGRKKPKTQDGRALRRYKRRWSVERLWSWIQRARRVVVRYEYYLENFKSFVLIACSIILMRRLPKLCHF